MQKRWLWIGPLLVILFNTHSASAALVSLGIEPIVGYEKVQQVLPSKHSTTRLMYGARLTAGFLFFSGEAEYTTGKNQESFSGMDQTHTVEHLKAGIRSGFGIGSLIQFFARGGVQATRGKTEQTVGGVTTTSTEATRYNPYAGASARVRLTSHLSASADVVAVIPDFQHLDQNEYQVTAGFIIRFP
jgi:hypothetical protein